MLAFFALQACDQNSETYNIEVSLEGSEGKWVKLMALEGREYVTYDSALSEAANPAILNLGIEGVNTMYLTVEDMEGSIQLLVENSNYEIGGSLEDPVIKTNSKAQSDLNAYNEQSRAIRDQMSELVTELRKGADPANPGRSDSIRKVYYSLYDEQNRMDSVYIEENPSSYATVLALRGRYYMLDASQLESALAKLDAPLREMEEYKMMFGKMERLKAVEIGKEYTDFALETPGGDLLKVSDVHQGNVLMIDFWASWCGPCRRANPEVVEIYNTYHDQGFEILGVSLDRDSARWVQAIVDDQLTWHHISDLKYWESAGAELYGVSAIPHTVLIDRDGIIAAKNLHGDELRQKIQSLL